MFFTLDLLMPSEQYALQLQKPVPAQGSNKNEPVAKLDQQTSKVTALQEGQTNIVLLHKNILLKLLLQSHVYGIRNSDVYVNETSHCISAANSNYFVLHITMCGCGLLNAVRICRENTLHCLAVALHTPTPKRQTAQCEFAGNGLSAQM